MATDPDNVDTPREAIVEVEDTGRGITEENLSRIFVPFYTTSKNGTGLGLPAVRRIARAHGGRVNVKSTPGLGSTFHNPIAARSALRNTLNLANCGILPNSSSQIPQLLYSSLA